MKKTIGLILISLLPLLSMAGSEKKDLSDYVDPNIGTAHSRWFFYTPAAMPFGMVKPSPTTDGHYGNKYGWDACGYDERHSSIEGFANFREFQIGGIALMPAVGELKTIPGSLENPDEGFRSRFSHDEETARPGYYKVLLDDYGVTAELTATPRVAFHRYTFPKSEQSRVIFNIGYRQGESGAVVDAYTRKVSETEVEGFVVTHPEYVKVFQPGSYVRMYFSARMDKVPSSFGTFKLDEAFPGQESVQGEGSGMYFDFQTEDGEAVEVKIGLSYTSIENARGNLDKEASELDFDEALTKAKEKWEDMLGRITVEGGSEQHMTKFYTGLYHALLGRGLASDANGAYVRFDGTTGKIPLTEDGTPKYNHYNTDAVWGAFWNLTQLWAMAYPDYYSEFVQCQLDFYKNCGWLPDGIATSKFVSGVGTNFTGLVIASAYTRGIRDFDVSLAWDAVNKNESGWMGRPHGVGKPDTKTFIDNGYVPFAGTDDSWEHNALGSTFSASHTLEYSFSAYAAAQFAKGIGKDKEFEYYSDLAKGWKKLYDSETGYIRPRKADGSFIENFDPSEVWRGFQEGNAYQYTFYVPHDPEGLVEMVGTDQFNERLNDLFERARETGFGGGKEIDAFAGLQNVYNHGNQPSLHIAWLFNFSGAPWLTQQWVREICDTFYGTDGIHGYGYGQDEDQGQLGAWYVLAGVGLFDVKGGTSLEPTLQLATPQFKKIRIRLHPDYYEGSEFVIRVKGNPTNHAFIKSASLNGKELDEMWFPWSEFTKGGELEIKTSSKPLVK